MPVSAESPPSGADGAVAASHDALPVWEEPVSVEAWVRPSQSFLAGDGDAKHTQVTIAADKMVPFEDFVHVMDACQKAGVTSIGIAAKPA